MKDSKMGACVKCHKAGFHSWKFNPSRMNHVSASTIDDIDRKDNVWLGKRVYPPKVIKIFALDGSSNNSEPYYEEMGSEVPIEKLRTLRGVLSGQQFSVLKDDWCNTNMISNDFVNRNPHITLPRVHWSRRRWWWWGRFLMFTCDIRIK